MCKHCSQMFTRAQTMNVKTVIELLRYSQETLSIYSKSDDFKKLSGIQCPKFLILYKSMCYLDVNDKTCLNNQYLELILLIYSPFFFRYLRAVAYRWVTRWIFGFLGWDNTRPLPSCIYHNIRTTFPDGQLHGYATAHQREQQNSTLGGFSEQRGLWTLY